VLGLPTGAAIEPAAAKRHFRHLARLLHPDKCGLPGAAEAFSRVLEAFQLIDSGGRRSSASK